MTPLFFLPGAGGSAGFWRPVAERLHPDRAQRLFSWPGLGDEPHEDGVKSIDDLVTRVRRELTEPTDLIAQSMGGVIALRLALETPTLVRRLVLVGTSGGLPVRSFGAAEWREGYRQSFPQAASWITEEQADLSPRLANLEIPTLLIWGGNDPISPPAVGEHLRQILPQATLQVIPGADHDLAATHAPEVASLIHAHIS